MRNEFSPTTELNQLVSEQLNNVYVAQEHNSSWRIIAGRTAAGIVLSASVMLALEATSTPAHDSHTVTAEVTPNMHPAHARAAPFHLKKDSNNSDTDHWAGYGVSGISEVDDVTADFTVPSVTCPEDGRTNTTIWAGAGVGTDADPLYQTGIELLCTNGSLSDTVWHEVYSPDGDTGELSYTYTHPVSAGDQMIAQITPNDGAGGKQVDFLVQDYGSSATNPYPNWTDYTTSTYSTAPTPSQEECIVEDPTYGGITDALADFGTTDFITGTDAYAYGGCNVENDDNNDVISSSSYTLDPSLYGYLGTLWTDDIYDTSDSTTLANTSGRSASGEFTVTWDASS